MSESRDHFSPQAGAYAAFRPTYSPAFIAEIVELAPGRELAWDVGAGSGQASVLLAEHFLKVQATDVSARQLANARAHPRVTYVVAPAERSGLADASVDLVAVAQALHWFAGPPFYSEVERVLKPGGVIAAWSYGLLTIDPAVDRVVAWFYGERIGKWWPEERRHVESRYRELPFPYPDLPLAESAIEGAMSREELVGYVSTWSALRHAREGEATDPLLEFVDAVREAWPDEGRRSVRWPMVVRAGRKP